MRNQYVTAQEVFLRSWAREDSQPVAATAFLSALVLQGCTHCDVWYSWFGPGIGDTEEEAPNCLGGGDIFLGS